MTVSESDRDYMRRIGDAKAGSHAEAAARHRALPVAERLRKSWALYRTGRASVRDEVRDDDPVAFYVRARMLGMYRP